MDSMEINLKIRKNEGGYLLNCPEEDPINSDLNNSFWQVVRKSPLCEEVKPSYNYQINHITNLTKIICKFLETSDKRK